MNSRQTASYGAIDAPVHSGGEIPGEDRANNIGDDIAAKLEAEAEDLQKFRALAPATAGAAAQAVPWRAAKSLLTLRNQVNAKAPGRNTDSDGIIGDTNHQNRSSDHNPWVQDGSVWVVTAMDITHDPNKGCDAGALAKAIQGSQDQRVKYIIWNRRISNSLPMDGKPAWAWRPYTGPNPHDKHVHISVKPDKPSYESTAAWTI